jgi:pilus assembly protein CpaC
MGDTQHASLSGEDAAGEVSLTVGKAIVMDFVQPVQRVAVGLNDVAEASAISPTEVLLNGKTSGQTSLIIWQRGGDRQFFNVTVRTSRSDSDARIEAIRKELRLEFPGQSIRVTYENGSIFLRGRVTDLNSSDRAVQIASTALAGSSPAAKGPLGLPSSDASLGKVVNLLYIDVPPAEKQVLLKVRFASVDRSKARQLGINLFSLGLGNTVGGITTGQFTPPVITSGGSSNNGISNSGPSAVFSNELNFLAFFPGLNAGADIQALETKGVLEVLAQPNVIAANGKQASFLAGGEYPYPVAQGGASGSGPTITIMFKEFGVRLNFIPTVTPRGSIRLQVAPEVSSLDFTNSVQISGFQVPAISSRKVNTEVELNEGQSFVIGGLLDNRETETMQKIPFIGDVPVLGKFFQSISRSRTNTELIVIVTPELVDPIPAGQALPDLKYPTSFLPPNSSIPVANPDGKDAGTTRTPPSQTIPVEKLVQSQKPGKPLIIDQGFSATSGSTGGGASSQ